MRKRITVKDLVGQFLEWAADALAAGTVLSYSHQLGKFVKRHGGKSVRCLKPIHVTRWAKSWHEVQAILRLMNWAIDEAKLLKRSPFEKLKPPPRNERRRIMKPTDMAALLRAADPAGRRYLLALRETFARPQEIRAARWDEIASEDPSVPVEQALAEGTAVIVQNDYKDRRRRKEASKPRILLVNRRLGRLLLRAAADRQPHDAYIFLNSRKQPWTNNAVRCLMRRLRHRLDIKPDRFGETVVAYTFRHSVATLASARGIKDRTLADLLGHVETRTTARYQHLDVGHLREALKALRENPRRGKR